MNKNAQNGNAIIMILVAVSLFAALGYAFSNTSRTSTSFINDEKSTAYANQIIAYGNEVKSAVKRLTLHGCTDTEISFENNVVAGYTNPNSPTDKSCHIFDIAGGGLQRITTPTDIFDNAYSSRGEYGNHQFYGGSCIHDVPSASDACGLDTIDNEELIIALHFIQKNICLKINKQFDIPDSSGDAPRDLGCALEPYAGFIGTYTEENTINTSVSAATDIFAGKKTGCYKSSCGTANDGYIFYNVLIAR